MVLRYFVSKLGERFKAIRKVEEMLGIHQNTPRDLCFIDVETTGPILGLHEIIELAAIRTDTTGTVKREWCRRIKPRFPGRAVPEATRLNGFAEKAWAGAEEPNRELWEEFAKVVRNCVAICQNPSFDRAFITLAAQKFSVDFGIDYHWIGTESLAWPLFAFKEIPDVRLASICKYFNIPIEPRPHGALRGAQTHLAVYRALMAYYNRPEMGTPTELSEK
jgi:DNA polymerase III epsilon subunit-like protein